MTEVIQRNTTPAAVLALLMPGWKHSDRSVNKEHCLPKGSIVSPGIDRPPLLPVVKTIESMTVGVGLRCILITHVIGNRV
jgi:hypothetical protein